MNTDVTTQSALYEEFAKQFARATSTNKFVFGFLGISAIIFILFGFLIWVIAFGVFYGILKLALIFDAPYRLLVWVCHFQNLPPHLVKPPLKSVIYSLVSLIFPALFVFAGVKGLQNTGFYSQNIIWIFSRAFSIIFSP
jgi:divalent metal cation (Fe/Co/Zn/Cd) transporter